jgi:hypothetical protein
LCFQRLEERLKSRFTDHRWLSRLLKNSLSGVHRRDAEDAEETPRVKTKKLPSGFLCDSAVRKHSFIIPLVIASHNEPMSQWPGDPSSQGLSAKATTFSPQIVYNLPLSLDQRGSPGPGPAFPSESPGVSTQRWRVLRIAILLPFVVLAASVAWCRKVGACPGHSQPRRWLNQRQVGFSWSWAKRAADLQDKSGPQPRLDSEVLR